jgi:hypothetical protein
VLTERESLAGFLRARYRHMCILYYPTPHVFLTGAIKKTGFDASKHIIPDLLQARGFMIGGPILRGSRNIAAFEPWHDTNDELPERTNFSAESANAEEEFSKVMDVIETNINLARCCLIMLGVAAARAIRLTAAWPQIPSKPEMVASGFPTRPHSYWVATGSTPKDTTYELVHPIVAACTPTGIVPADPADILSPLGMTLDQIPRSQDGLAVGDPALWVLWVELVDQAMSSNLLDCIKGCATIHQYITVLSNTHRSDYTALLSPPTDVSKQKVMRAAFAAVRAFDLTNNDLVKAVNHLQSLANPGRTNR